MYIEKGKGVNQMENIALKEKMVRFYNSKAGAHTYIWGFAYNGNVWMVRTGNSELMSALKLDKASRGAGYALRFKPSKSLKVWLLSKGAEILCSEKFFNELLASTKYNRGEIFEKLVTEHFGQVWTKDNIPFTEQGDINVDGIEIQIKFEKATFINEAQIERMERA